MLKRLAPLVLGLALLASGDHLLCVSAPAGAEGSAPSCHPEAGGDQDADAATPDTPSLDHDPAACAVACGLHADLPAAGPPRPHLRPERAEPAEGAPSLPLLSSGVEHIPLA